MIRLYVIDDHPFIFNGLKNWYRPSRDGIDMTGNASNPADAIANADPNTFDIIILDLWLGQTHPHDNVKNLMEKFPDKPIIILTYEDSPFWVQSMIQAGVKAYLLKNTDRKKMKITLETVSNGGSVFPDFYNTQIASVQNPADTMLKIILKPSEREIFRLLGARKSDVEIAAMLFKSISTIEKTIRKVNRQLNAKSSKETIHILTSLKEI